MQTSNVLTPILNDWLKLIAGNQILKAKRASKNWQIEGGVASKVLKRVTYSEYSGDLAWRGVVSQERRTPTEASLFINSATDPTTCRFPNQIRCHKEDVDAQGMSTILDPLTIYLHFFRRLLMFSIRNLVTWFEHLSPVRRMTRTDQVSRQGTRAGQFNLFKQFKQFNLANRDVSAR